jgi:hypothetical protein
VKAKNIFTDRHLYRTAVCRVAWLYRTRSRSGLFYGIRLTCEKIKKNLSALAAAGMRYGAGTSQLNRYVSQSTRQNECVRGSHEYSLQASIRYWETQGKYVQAPHYVNTTVSSAPTLTFRYWNHNTHASVWFLGLGPLTIIRIAGSDLVRGTTVRYHRILSMLSCNSRLQETVWREAS